MGRFYPNRVCELTKWKPFTFITNINDMQIHIKRGLLSAEEVNAASNTTIVLARMLRKGRMDIGKRRTP